LKVIYSEIVEIQLLQELFAIAITDAQGVADSLSPEFGLHLQRC